MTEPELLPCPCCKTVASASDNTVIGGWFIHCENAKCQMRSGTFPTQPMAIRAWNTRAPSTVGVEDEIDRDDPQFNRGVNHVVDLLAKTIGSTDWVAGDGSEDYDEDLAQTLLNILEAKGLYDCDEGKFASLQSPTLASEKEGREALADEALKHQAILGDPHNHVDALAADLVFAGESEFQSPALPDGEAVAWREDAAKLLAEYDAAMAHQKTLGSVSNATLIVMANYGDLAAGYLRKALASPPLASDLQSRLDEALKQLGMVSAKLGHAEQQLRNSVPASAGVREAIRLLNRIADLAYDEDVGEPLDDAIGYANKALAALASGEKK